MLSLGLDALGATNNVSGIPDGQFLSFFGQAQYVRQIDETPLRWVARISGQFAEDGLLPLEQIAVGGSATVRGHAENQLVRDNGVIGTLELQWPVIVDTNGQEHLTLIGFLDAGWADNVDRRSGSDDDVLASVGLGLQFDLFDRIQGRLYWGQRLISAADVDDGLQDNGVHFSVTLRAF